MTLEDRVRDLEMHVNPRWMPPEWKRQQEAAVEKALTDPLPLLEIEMQARILHELLTGKPRHLIDSAPVQEALQALGVALGVET